MADIEFFWFSTYLIPGRRADMYIKILFLYVMCGVIMCAEDIFDLPARVEIFRGFDMIG